MTTGAPHTDAPARLAEIFAGRRGRLLLALLAAEFGAAVQGIAYSTVLPVAASQLHGQALYGATLSASALAIIFMLTVGQRWTSRMSASTALWWATGLFAAGALLSAFAPAMVFVLIGSLIRGLAGGIIAGFGYTALGALYEDRLRPRVMNLFTLMWLVPSLLGPPVNAAITASFGWRWAMLWPALLVVGARALIGANAKLIPTPGGGGGGDDSASGGTGRLDPWTGAGIVLAIIAASWASSQRGSWAVALFAAGLIAALLLSLRMFAHAAGGDRLRFMALTAFFGACLSYFGAEAVMSLAVISGLGGGVLAGGAAVGAAGVTWSLVGLWPAHPARRRFGRAPIGMLVMVLGLGCFAAVLAFWSNGGAPAVWAALGAAAVVGVGIGITYSVQSSATFDALTPERVPLVATATAFADTGSTTVGALLTGGIYSLATSGGAAPAPVLADGIVVTAVIGLVVVWLTAASFRRPGGAVS